MSVAEKVVLITGGGSGVGKAAAKAFAEAGAKVAIAGRDGNKLFQAGMDLQVPMVAFQCDVSVSENCQKLIKDCTEHFGRVDILVNNAGTNLKERTMRELTPEAWDKMIAANLNGAFYLSHAVLPQMLERQDGVIVNVVSIAGKRGNPLGGAAYVAAKFGMGGLGMVLSNEEREHGIRVSNIYPGEIDTPILVNRPKPVTDEQRAVILKPEDVASAVVYVAGLPKHVSIPELIMKPAAHLYW
jgi:NADP-dependent 3-hydroxy acid dehydrogenase YdfG